MPTSSPGPEGHFPPSDTPAAAAGHTAPDRHLPYPSDPQPHRFGPTPSDARTTPPLAPTPPAGPGWGQPPPYQVVPVGPRPLPSVAIIWLNIVVFGWFLGIGLIYGVVRCIQGIARSRERGLSPTRYVLPLVFIAVVFLLLVILGATHGNSAGGGNGGPGLTPG